MPLSDLLSNFILAASDVLVQGVALGILLVVVVHILLKLAGDLNGSTRGLVWLATLLAMPLIPLLHWMNPTAPAPAISAVHAPAPPVPHAGTTVTPPSFAVQPIDLPVDHHAPFVVLALYLGISTLMLLRLFASYLRIRRLRRRAQPAPPEVQARLRHWLARCPTDRPVTLGMSDKLKSPVALGFFHPMILMPSALLLELNEEELDDLWVHELAHIRRYDDWSNLLQQVLKALLFFHPAVYWVCAKLKFESEVACDEWVAAARGPKSYARCLAKIVELRRWQRVALLSNGAFFSKTQVLRRVELLLDKTRHKATGLSGFTAVAVVLLTAGVVLQIAHTPGLINFSRESGGSHISAQWKGEARDLRFKLRGEMMFTPDERSIASLSPWGYVEIRESNGWLTRRLEVRGSGSGVPEQKYFVDGHERPLDRSGSEWAAATYPFVIREIGWDVNGRVERLRARGGVRAVLDEVDLIHSSGVKSKYITRLLDQAALTESDLYRIAASIRRIHSDQDKAQLLRAAAPYFVSEAARREYFQAVDSIRSDNDKASLLTANSESPAIGCDQLQAARTIHSDNEKARVLREPGNLEATSQCRDAFFEAVNQIRSDNDRSGVLRALLGRPNLEPAVYQSVAAATARMSSDNDKANVLVTLSESFTDAPLFDAVNTIRSDNDRKRVLLKVIQAAPSKEALLSAIDSASRMPSENDKAEILVAAAKLSTDSGVRSAVQQACSKIRSDNDYRRVASALLSVGPQ
jgi:beta-lactamase regulating signal transducer with metallopeptidase domain